MPRFDQIDFTTWTPDSVQALATTPGPLAAEARRFLNRGGQPRGAVAPVLPALLPPPVMMAPAAPAAPVGRGDYAYAILTPEQKAEVDAQVAQVTTSAKVEQATVALVRATQAVTVAATAAQEVITAAAPIEGVDTAALEAAVAVVQPVVDAQPAVSAPESATPVAGEVGAPVEAPAS